MKKLFSRSSSLPIGLAIGLLVSLLITFAGAAVITILLSSQKVEEGSVKYFTFILKGVAVMIGAWVAFKMVKRLRLQVCLLSGIFYYLTLMAMTALFFGGQYSGLGISVIVVLACSAIVAFFPEKQNKKWKKDRRAYH